MPSPVTVNLHVNIDASGNIVVFGSDADSTTNIVEAVGYQLPVNALYDRTINNDNTNGAAGAGLIEFWEPVSDLGNIYAKLATSADFNVEGQPSYKRTAKLLASGLERVLVDTLDAKAAIPFTSYNNVNYTNCSDLGRLALGVYAHYLFGHIGATAAITNDEAIMTNMLSLTYGTSSVKNGGLPSNRFLAWTKKSIIDNVDVDSWDASQNPSDANIAIALTKAILAKGANDVVSAVQDTPIRSVAGIQFSTDSLANIVKQVLGQDASRAMGQDNNTLAPNVRQILRFYDGDVIYVSITLKQPGVSVGHGYSNAGAPLSSTMTEQKYDIKINLGPRNIEYDPPILTVASSYTGVVADTATFKNVAQTMAFNNSQPIPLSTLGIDVSASPNDAATKLIRNDVITTLFNLRQDISQFTVNRSDIGLTTSQTANDKIVVIKSVESAIAPPIPVDSVVNSTTSVYAPLVYIGDMNRFSIRSNVFTIYKKGVDVYSFTDNDGVVSLHKSGDIILYEGVSVEIGSAIVSDASGSISTPSAPTNLTAVPSNGQATVSFTPGSNGGISITNYKYSIDGGVTYTTFSPAVTSSPVVIGGLTNGTTYSIKLRAVNNVGTGDASFSVSVTPGGAPMPPTELSTVAGDAQVIVSFTPGSDSGSPITNYKYSIDGGSTYVEFSPAVTSSPVTISGLTNGTTYSIKLRAVNEVSDGGASSSVSATPDVLSSAPASLSAVAGDGQAVITFTPGANNGSAITNYKYSVDGGATFTAFSPAVTSSPATIGGLTNGTAYSIKLRTVNGAGDSEASASVSVTPAGLPFAPSSLSAVGGDGEAIITFTPGANNGSAITNYRYSIDGGATYTDFSPAVTSSPVTISGLTNGTTYSIKFRAINSVGIGGASSSVSVTPDVIASAPDSLSAVAGDGQTTITFTPGANNGSAITNYKYSVDDGVTFVAFSPAVTSSPATIGGLTNGTAYSIKLLAINGTGDSEASASVSVTPAGLPFAPSGLSAVGGDGEAIITFTPGANNGSAITNYKYSINGGATYTAFSPAVTSSPITITGLDESTSYLIKLRPVNSLGDGGASSSVSVTTFGIPSAPTSITPVPGDSQVSISFTPGAINGSAITNYKYSLDDGVTFTAFSPAVTGSPVLITGLTNNTTYSIKIRAVNGYGDGIMSSTITAIPFGLPSPPTSLSVSPGNGQVTISFTAGSNGGKEITNYNYSINGGTTYTAFSPAVTSSPVTITGLANGTTYSVLLKAVNIVGDSVASSSISAKPGIPSIPTNLIATPGSGQITLSFTTAANNGSPITNYKYSIDGGATYTAFNPAVTSSPVTITGLTNGTTYSVKVRAVNGFGDGIESASVSVTPAGLPSAPTLLSVISDNNQLTLNFTPGSNNGSAITNYMYSTTNGSTFKAVSPAITSSPITITIRSDATTGFINGTQYFVVLRAVNSIGQSLTHSNTISIIAGQPAAPTNVSGISDAGNIIISFTPGSSGATAITNYEYSINGGTYTACSPVVTSSPLTIISVSPSYTYKIRARNSIMYGQDSATISIPVGPPNAPTNLIATLGHLSAIISFTRGYDNGAGYDNYKYSINGGTTYTLFNPVIRSSPVTITGLTAGTIYNVLLKGVNSYGDSPASSSISFTAVAVPSAPTNLIATPGDGQAVITFTPGANNGSAITNYKYSINGGATYTAFSPAVTSSPVTIGGLTNGTTYPIRLQAVNAIGDGVPSSSVSVKPDQASAKGIAQWATYLDGTGYDQGLKNIVDSSGNVYVTGYYTSTTNVTVKNVNGTTQSNSSILLQPTSGYAMYLVKYNSSGIAQWATLLDGTITDHGTSLAIDSSNNIYVTGIYYSTSNTTIKDVSGNTQSNSSITLPVTSTFAMYLVKYNSSGIAQWATLLDGIGYDSGTSLAIDSSDNIYVSGIYNSNVTVKNVSGNTQTDSSIALPVVSSSVAYLVKYNSSGISQWATFLDGTGSDEGLSLAIDSSNNIYVTGFYTSTTDVTVKNVNEATQSNSSIILPATSSNAMYLVKYNSSGIAQWATLLDGINNDNGSSLAIDSSNNIYVTGIYTSDVTVKNVSGNTQVNSYITLPSTTSSIYLVKYNSSGIAQWATYLAASGSNYGKSLVTDSFNNIYVTGIYNSTVTVKNVSGNTQVSSSISLASPSYSAMYLVKYTPSGIALWATYLDGTSNDGGNSISINSLGNIYISGYYNSTSGFMIKNANGNTQTDSSISLLTTSNSAMFLIKYN